MLWKKKKSGKKIKSGKKQTVRLSPCGAEERTGAHQVATKAHTLRHAPPQNAGEGHIVMHPFDVHSLASFEAMRPFSAVLAAGVAGA